MRFISLKSTMKAVILAAGFGSRLKHLTNEKPKTLVEINNKPILSFIIDSLEKAGIREIIICVGYKASQINNFCQKYPHLNFTFVENSKFDSTNNMYSLYLTRNYFDDDVIILDSDLIFHPKIVQVLVKQGKTTLLYDKIFSYDKSLEIEGNDDEKMIQISKQVLEKLNDRTSGGSTCIFKIVKNDLKSVKNELEKLIGDEKRLNEYVWMMLYNLLNDGRIEGQLSFLGHKYSYDVDTQDELQKAETAIKNSTLFMK